MTNDITAGNETINPEKVREDMEQPDLHSTELYVNREISWIHFNQRVLEEALNREAHPLLERVKFISIFSSNLDEYFMIRVAGIEDQYEAGIQDRTIDGYTPSEQLEHIRSMVAPQLMQRNDCFYNDLLPEMEKEGISFVRFTQLPKQQQEALRTYFRQEIYPVLTPLAFDTGHPFPFMSSLSLNLAIELEDSETGASRFARVKVPSILPRMLSFSTVEGLGTEDGVLRFIWLEDLIQNNLTCFSLKCALSSPTCSALFVMRILKLRKMKPVTFLKRLNRESVRGATARWSGLTSAPKCPGPSKSFS